MSETRRWYFSPVEKPTATNVYLEIGRRRWEGWPATIIAAAILTGPLYLVFAFLLIVSALT